MNVLENNLVLRSISFAAAIESISFGFIKHPTNEEYSGAIANTLIFNKLHRLHKLLISNFLFQV